GGYGLSTVLPAAFGNLFPTAQRGSVPEHDRELRGRSGLQYFSGHSRARGCMGSFAVLDYPSPGIYREFFADQGRSPGQSSELSAFFGAISPRSGQEKPLPSKPDHGQGTAM